MLKIGIIVGSTRPGRKAAAVAKWVLDILKSRKDAEFEIVDIEDYKLPLLDEPVPPSMHQYSKPHTNHWSEKLSFPRMEQQVGGVCRIWRRWRCPSGGEFEARDGRDQDRGRASAGGAFDV